MGGHTFFLMVENFGNATTDFEFTNQKFAASHYMKFLPALLMPWCGMQSHSLFIIIHSKGTPRLDKFSPKWQQLTRPRVLWPFSCHSKGVWAKVQNDLPLMTNVIYEQVLISWQSLFYWESSLVALKTGETFDRQRPFPVQRRVKGLIPVWTTDNSNKDKIPV